MLIVLLMKISLKTSKVVFFCISFLIYCVHCYVCPPGFAWNLGQNSCWECYWTEYCPGDDAHHNCAAGTYSNAFRSPACKTCPSGSYPVSSWYCLNCAAGTYSVSGDASCSASCPAGYYTQAGGTQCLPCPAGTYSSSSGGTSVSNCISCSSAQYSLPGSTSCLGTCPAGSYMSSSPSQCALCPAGTANPSTTTSSTACTPCSIGYYSAVGSSACSPCPLGTYASSTGSVQCTTCPDGTVNPNAGSTSSASCVSCSGGTYAGTGLGNCQPQCPPGFYLSGSNCVYCPGGNYNLATNLASSCPLTCGAGTYTGLGGDYCFSCPPGTYNPSTGVSCIQCLPGTYFAGTGATSASACQTCPTGTFSTGGSSSCGNFCPTGLTVSGSACVCSPGNYVPAYSTTCTNCLAGTFSVLGDICTNCPAGSWSAAGAAACVNCSAGFSCPASSTTSTACTSCLSGTWSIAGGACTNCLAGTYSGAGATTCPSCSVGQWSAAGATSCTNCNAGYSSPAGSASCTPCPAGTWSSAGTACTPCGVGTYSSSSTSTSCTPCAIAYYQSLTGQSSCLICPKGTFQPQTGQSACTPCAAGNYNYQTGQTSCLSCNSGTFQANTGGVTCIDCPTGTYQPSTSQAACINCLAGFYQNYVGQTKCFSCNVGSYSSSSGSSSCMTCSPGSSQPLQGQSICNLCAAGSYQDSAGQASCKTCPPGTSQNQIGSAVPCNNCAAGTFNPNSGSTSCQACPPKSYQYLTGQTSCIICTKSYCGPCQFNNRTICTSLNGLCWVDYNDFSVNSPLNTTTCLQAVAPICYQIWNTSKVTDSQCLDFVQSLNFTQMGIKVNLTNATFSSDALYIIANFDNPIYRIGFTDCSTVFPQSFLNWLPAGYACSWFNSTMLQVNFDPTVGAPPSITIMPNSFHYDYPYSMVSADAATVPIVLPHLQLNMIIAGLTMISECDNLELLANIASPIPFPLVFAWNISFITVGQAMSAQALNATNNYFKAFSVFGTLKPLTIASSYYVKDSSLNVTLFAKAASGDSDTASTWVIVNIVGDIPKIKFSIKSQAVTGLPGYQRTVLSIQIANKRCIKTTSRRMLQSASTSSLIPISIKFLVFSGVKIQTMLRADLEKKLEALINKMYSTYHILSIDLSQGFQYGRYYKFMAIVTNLENGVTNNDTDIFSFSQPQLTSVIDQIGSIVSIQSNVTLNGGNSTFPQSKGELIGYKWACLNCTPLTKSGSCSCPAISRIRSMMPKLTLQNNTLVNLCKYVFKLTVSSMGYLSTRTCISQVEFITLNAPILPVKGVIIQGKSNKVKDIYFSFQISFPGPDSSLQFNWTLVEIQSYDPKSTIFYSQRNAFLSSFLAGLGVVGYDSGGSQDVPIPSSMMPIYLTPTLTRFLGVNQSTIIPQYKYTFAVVVNYPAYPSFVYVQFTAPKAPRSRLFSISPVTGVGFSTVFSLAFMLPNISDVDSAQYQIYRKDCPSNKKSSANSVSQVMGTSNLFTSTLAPGDPTCNFQVEIVLRSIEYNDFIEQSVIVTVTASSTPASTVISNQLNSLVVNNASLTIDQTVSTLCMVSSVNQTEKSAETQTSVITMMQLVSTIDSPTGGSLTLCNPPDMPKVLNTTSNILGGMVNNQAATVDLQTAGNVSWRATAYLSLVINIDGATSMIPSIVISLSGVADIGKSQDVNSSFYTSHQQALGNMTGMKLNETQPGSLPYSVSSKSLEIVVQKGLITAFNSSQNATTEKGSQLNIPGGLQNQLQNAIINLTGKTNNTLAVGTSLSALSYNPYSNIKKGSVINTTSIPNNPTDMVPPSTVSSIYNDLSRGKLQSVVDDTEQSTDIIQAGFTPSQIQKNSSEKLAGSNIIIYPLPNNSKAYYQFPTTASSNNINSNNSLMTPLYYNAASKKWTNDGCKIESSNTSNIGINVSCDNIGLPLLNGIKNQNVINAISIVVDILKDLLAVLMAGNYASLYDFGSFLTAPATNWAVLACVFVFFIIVAIIALRLHKLDKSVLHYQRIKTLYARYGIKPKDDGNGLLKRVYGFLSSLKLNGAKNAVKKMMNEAPARSSPPSSSKRRGRKEPRNYVTNGFNQLSWMEEKELVDLFYLYHENSYLFSDEELYAIMYNSIHENKVLRRLTQQRLLDIILEDPSFCTVLIVKIYFIFYSLSILY